MNLASSVGTLDMLKFCQIKGSEKRCRHNKDACTRRSTLSRQMQSTESADEIFYRVRSLFQCLAEVLSKFVRSGNQTQLGIHWANFAENQRDDACQRLSRQLGTLLGKRRKAIRVKNVLETLLEPKHCEPPPSRPVAIRWNGSKLACLIHI